MALLPTMLAPNTGGASRTRRVLPTHAPASSYSRRDMDPSPSRSTPPATGQPILGRRRELAALREWLEAARHGTGRLVLCAGEPGIGKTKLAQELAGVALASGTGVAWGRCAEGEGAPAFWPWRQVGPAEGQRRRHRSRR